LEITRNDFEMTIKNHHFGEYLLDNPKWQSLIPEENHPFGPLGWIQVEVETY